MSDSAEARKRNLNQIRRVLWQGSQYTKLAIANQTGLSVATCNTLLNELEKKGEVVGEKQKLREVGRSSVVYRINEEFEPVILLDYQLIQGVRSIRTSVVAVTGNILWQHIEKCQQITANAISECIESALKQYPASSIIVVGTPSVAENGVVQYCDVPEMENTPLVSVLSGQFHLPVILENDMHLKAFGYYKKEDGANDIVTIATFPAHVLPGTVTVYQGTILKGKNQMAGMVRFLPYAVSWEEQIELMEPETAFPIIVYILTSLIATLNPSVMLLTGNLLSEDSVRKVRAECLEMIPEEYMPEFRFVEDIDKYYIAGMLWRALEWRCDYDRMGQAAQRTSI